MIYDDIAISHHKRGVFRQPGGEKGGGKEGENEKTLRAGKTRGEKKRRKISDQTFVMWNPSALSIAPPREFARAVNSHADFRVITLHFARRSKASLCKCI